VNAGAAGQEIKVEISPRDNPKSKPGDVNNDKSLNLELHKI